MLAAPDLPSPGLKTGLYYLRTKAAADAIKFTVDVQKLSKTARLGDIPAMRRDTILIKKPSMQTKL